MSEPSILIGQLPGKIRKSGRPKGSGPNLKLLAQLTKPDACIWGLSFKKMRSIYVSALEAGIKVKTRKLDDLPRKQSSFAIWRIQ